MSFQESHFVSLVNRQANLLGGCFCRSEKLAQSGSSRLYFRILLDNNDKIIGAYNNDIRENRAFFYFTRFFNKQQLNVPQLLAVDDSECYYLLSDLGDTTLYAYLQQERAGALLGEKVKNWYRKVIEQLPKWQLSALQTIDFSACYPRYAFDRQSIQWDLNYFKYYFLKLAAIPFDEQLLENDFQAFTDWLLEADSGYFLYRDFQSRNIMLYQDDVYFIDYQGGRKGALQYDIASLLYDAKAAITPAEREELLQYYLEELSKYQEVDKKQFVHYFDGFVLVRILQALGTYGFRGYYEKKAHFLQSIPYVVENINYLLQKGNLPTSISYLYSVLQQLTKSDFVYHYQEAPNKLTVIVTSFSYKKGIPVDFSPNGGGFVFDCRALPNPGRTAALRTCTGKDAPVRDWIAQYPEFEEFNQHTWQLVSASVRNYLARKFTHLMVNFGCTGGQHRSVYCAEQLAAQLRRQFPEIVVMLHHTNFRG
jgi:aminoglycoside/choline kinase family phosphotransferase